VSVTPTLAGKFGARPPSGPATAASSANANVLGVWRGDMTYAGKTHHLDVTIKQSADGSLHALFYSPGPKWSFVSTSVVSQGNRLKMTWYNDRAAPPNVNTLEGDVNPDFGIIQAVWNWTNPKGAQSEKISLRRDPDASTAGSGYTVVPGDTLAKIAVKYNVPLRALEAANPGVPPAQLRLGQRLVIPTSGAAPALGTPVSLADLTHSLTVQLFDQFKGEQFFGVMGGADLKQAIAPTGQPPNPPYDLAKPDTAAQFKQAGINYLLVTSVEDFSDQTIEKRRTKDFHYQTGVYYGASVYASRLGRNGAFGASASAGAGVTTQGGFDPEVWQQQTIRLTVRCQLYDAATGELKKSTTGTFPFQRDYTAVAQGVNQLSTADLCEAAARNVAAWAGVLVDDAIFPIRVYAKNDQEITISRGAEAGLKVGQVFDVCVQGEAIKDPDTGKILGYDVKPVGRVAVTKLEPKFSHAKVLEDKGIVAGATLVKAVY